MKCVPPLVFMRFLWYPGSCALATKTDTSGLGAGILRCNDVSIAPGGVWPDSVGAAMGFYHTDWSTWDRLNDPAFKNVGTEFVTVPALEVGP